MTSIPRATGSGRTIPLPFVRIIVLNYNAGPALARCVSSLLELEWPTDRREIAIIDNASTDDSLGALGDTMGLRFLRNSTNTGFAANNLLMTDLDGVDRVALVNPDAVVRPDWLHRLESVIDIEERIGAACPLIQLAGRFRTLAIETAGTEVEMPLLVRSLMPQSVTWHLHADRMGRTKEGGREGWEAWAPIELRVAESQRLARVEIENPSPIDRRIRVASGSHERTVSLPAGASKTCEIDLGSSLVRVVQNAGSSIGPTGVGQNRGYLESTKTMESEGALMPGLDVDAWCGAGVLLHADYVRDVGGFDERLFLYYEDTDLSWRGRNRGWRYRFEPSAVMEHEHSLSVGHGSALYDHQHLRNRLLVATKNGTPQLALTAWRDAMLAAVGQLKHEVWRPLRLGRRPELLLAWRQCRSLLDACRMAPSFVRSRSEAIPSTKSDAHFDPRNHR